MSAQPKGGMPVLDNAHNLNTLRPFLSVSQRLALRYACRGEECDYFFGLIQEYADRVSTMPKTYEQDGKGLDAIAYLHYFNGGMDWYITEKDMGDGSSDDAQHQAFGLAAIGYEPELGYISIEELIENNVELDLHWTPKPLKEIADR